jgi:hypothetical protein
LHLEACQNHKFLSASLPSMLLRCIKWCFPEVLRIADPSTAPAGIFGCIKTFPLVQKVARFRSATLLPSLLPVRHGEVEGRIIGGLWVRPSRPNFFDVWPPRCVRTVRNSSPETHRDDETGCRLPARQIRFGFHLSLRDG